MVKPHEFVPRSRATTTGTCVVCGEAYTNVIHHSEEIIKNEKEVINTEEQICHMEPED